MSANSDTAIVRAVLKGERELFGRLGFVATGDDIVISSPEFIAAGDLPIRAETGGERGSKPKGNSEKLGEDFGATY